MIPCQGPRGFTISLKKRIVDLFPLANTKVSISGEHGIEMRRLLRIHCAPTSEVDYDI